MLSPLLRFAAAFVFRECCRGCCARRDKAKGACSGSPAASLAMRDHEIVSVTWEREGDPVEPSPLRPSRALSPEP